MSGTTLIYTGIALIVFAVVLFIVSQVILNIYMRSFKEVWKKI